jgi:hypothetical protein
LAGASKHVAVVPWAKKTAFGTVLAARLSTDLRLDKACPTDFESRVP